MYGLDHFPRIHNAEGTVLVSHTLTERPRVGLGRRGLHVRVVTQEVDLLDRTHRNMPPSVLRFRGSSRDRSA
jgi:hypothetical protein